MRHPGPVVQDVERGGHELAEFIPEIGEPEERRVNDEDEDGEGQPEAVASQDATLGIQGVIRGRLPGRGRHY